MTRQELETELKKIGWSIKPSPNGLNDHIINDLGGETSFVVGKERLEIRTSLFGADNKLAMGACKFPLSTLKVYSGKYIDDAPISFVEIEFGGGSVIQFYNHNGI